MEYLEEYKKIFDGGQFLRNGKLATFQNYRAFDGGGIRMIVPAILKVLEERETVTVLDYGCGEAVHWHRKVLENRTMSFCELFGMKLQSFYRYDPACRQFSKPPTGTFDFIVCSDVLEHIPEEEVTSFLETLAVHTTPESAVFFSVSTRPSNNCFLDGTNTHVTQRPPKWWDAKISMVLKCPVHTVYDGDPG